MLITNNHADDPDTLYPRGFRVFSAGRWIDDAPTYADACATAAFYGNVSICGVLSNGTVGREVAHSI